MDKHSRDKPQIKREKIILKQTDTRPNSARKNNTKRKRKRAVTWRKFYTAKNMLIISGMCRKGWTNEEIAEYIGIAVSTYYEWIKKYPEFSEAVGEGKEYSVATVENALYQKACGIEKEITEKETVSVDVVDKSGKKMGTRTTTKERKNVVYIAPDTKAAIFYLTNRAGDDWKQKQQTELTGSLNIDANIKAVDRLKKAMERKEKPNETVAVDNNAQTGLQNGICARYRQGV